MVHVKAQARGEAWVCDVSVDAAGEKTEHIVGVTAADLARFGRGSSREDVEDLVLRRFEFLLRRERPSSILKRFELAVIRRYFPDYDRELSSL